MTSPVFFGSPGLITSPFAPGIATANPLNMALGFARSKSLGNTFGMNRDGYNAYAAMGQQKTCQGLLTQPSCTGVTGCNWVGDVSKICLHDSSAKNLMGGYIPGVDFDTMKNFYNNFGYNLQIDRDSTTNRIIYSWTDPMTKLKVQSFCPPGMKQTVTKYGELRCGPPSGSGSGTGKKRKSRKSRKSSKRHSSSRRSRCLSKTRKCHKKCPTRAGSKRNSCKRSCRGRFQKCVRK